MPRPFFRLLLHDVPLQAIVAVATVVVALDFLPGREPLTGGATVVRTLLLLAVAVAVVSTRHGVPETAAGNRFWHGATAAVVAFFVARLLDGLAEAPSALVVSGCDTLAWTLLATAAAGRPDRLARESPVEEERRERWWSLAGAAIFLPALWAELVLIPDLRGVASAVERGGPLLGLTIGTTLGIRFAAFARTAASTRWRLVYRHLTAAAVAAAALGGFELARVLRGDGAVPELVGLLPILPVLVAARASRNLRHISTAPGAGRKRSEPEEEPLSVYALALPVLHLALELAGLVDPHARATQAALALAWCGGVGAVGLLQSRRREARRQSAEGHLRDGELRYRQLIERHPDAILIEQEGELVYVNATAVKKLGLERSGEGQSFAALGFPTRPPLEERTLIPLDCRVTGARGEDIDLEVSYYDITYLGRPACQAIARDVTEARRFRAHSEKTERLAWLGQFSAALAHEIRNPLAAIVMHGFFLAERLPKDDEENLRTLADINAAIERMQKLVNGLLAFVRPPELQLMREDLMAVLDSARLELRRRTETAAVGVAQELRHERSTVRVDVHQMATAFTHILDNAVRAMPDGGTLTVRTANPSEDLIEVVIEDTGAGISNEDLERVFEPFYTRRDDGVGLGLAHVARIFDQHDCRYRMESEPGSGTRFIVDIPLTEGEPSRVTARVLG